MGIGGNECADVLSKEALVLDHLSNVTSDSEDANAVTKLKISYQRFIKPTFLDLSCLRNLLSTVSRLRTGPFKGMNISPDNSRIIPTNTRLYF
ncbi:hypothetical protein TNCT_298741 [Trichonephila clavata]|uniref:Uncharacterized protein n=1 Tax=Trichonephila clavata TaxID=2740835 RepID=A0A8X6GLG6_TRICU|nr:hypothetical protein TNCT_298741 [Trichonephila clavata]